MSRKILVSGATGKQGGALITALIQRKADFEILALTRDAASPSAQRLAAESSKITLIQGNLDDTEAIFAEAARKTSGSPIWGVFSVQTVTPGHDGPANEERQGKALVDSALKHGVEHFVYTSCARNGDQPTNVPHFASKYRIEEHLLSAIRSHPSSRYTILRPVAFMENLAGGFFSKIFATAWKTQVQTRPLQVVATGDVGRVAARAFLESGAFQDRVVEICGDELSWTEMATIHKEVTGKDVPMTFEILPSIMLRFISDARLMFNWFEEEGFGVDRRDINEVLPDVKNFRTWLTERN